MVKKIIALDIDEFRVGVYSPVYSQVFSSAYSEVKKNTWKLSFLKRNSQDTPGSEIKFEQLGEPIYWGMERRYSRRPKAYHTFGDILEHLEEESPIQLVKTILAYLAKNEPQLFEKTTDNQFKCSICVGVNARSSTELDKLEPKFEGQYTVVVDGAEFSITVEKAILVPKSFCSILENVGGKHAVNKDNNLQLFNGLNYIIDVNDHYVKCDVYDSGELIKSEPISKGLYEFANRIVQEYQTRCVQNKQRAFVIDQDMVYNVITNRETSLVINGQQEIDLSQLINEETTEETKKLLSFLTRDEDIQYADNIIIRDLKNGIIDQAVVNQYLENYGLHCTKIENKSGKGIYAFGERFLGDNFLGNDEENHEQKSTVILPQNTLEVAETMDKIEEISTAEMEPKEVETVANSEDTGIVQETSTVKSDLSTKEIGRILSEQNEILDSLIDGHSL